MSSDANKIEEYELVLASLLHDVGKIKQRASGGNQSHAEIGRKFVEELSNIPGNVKEVIAELVGNHHNDAYSGINLTLLNYLKIADRKSAGHDRKDRDKEYMNENEQYMKNPFGSISKEELNEIRGCDAKARDIDGIEGILPLVNLSKFPEEFFNWPDETNSTISRNKKLTNPRGYLGQLWNNLEHDLKELKFYGGNWKQYINNVLTILEEYTRFVPSAYYYSYPTVSLYDHLKLTAALSLCLYRNGDRDQSFLLIGAEFQGIQNYIFRKLKSEGSDEGMARRLRGRSFSVYLLTELVSLHILRELDLYRFNIVSTVGGKFWIIAPYSIENEQKLAKLRNDIETYFLKEHRGLGIALAWNKFSIEDLLEEDEGKKLGKEFRKLTGPVIRKIEARKNKIGNEIINEENYDNVFFPDRGSEIENNDICEACGIRLIKLTENNKDRCDICNNEENIGRMLVKSNELIVTSVEAQSKANFVAKFGDTVYYSTIIDEQNEFIDQKEIIERIWINKYSRKIFDSGDYGTCIVHNSNYAPRSEMNEFSVKTFEELAISEVKKDKYLPLALLKMDLDDNAILFASPYENFTISKYATQSFFTNYIFSEFLDRVAKKNDIYIVYSGGDDVVAIGKITRMFKFVSDFRTMVSELSLDRLSISAGMVTFNRNVPPRIVLEAAEENLKKSKSVNCTKYTRNKNSITLFDRILSWDDYFNMEELGNVLSEKVIDKKLSNQFLYYLLVLDYKNPYLTENFVPGKEITIPDPHVYYYLSRNYYKNEKDEDKRKKAIYELMEKIINKNIYKHIRVAINMAAYEYRDKGGD